MRSSGAVLARVGNDQGNAISDNGIAVVSDTAIDYGISIYLSIEYTSALEYERNNLRCAVCYGLHVVKQALVALGTDRHQ